MGLERSNDEGLGEFGGEWGGRVDLEPQGGGRRGERDGNWRGARRGVGFVDGEVGSRGREGFEGGRRGRRGGVVWFVRRGGEGGKEARFGFHLLGWRQVKAQSAHYDMLNEESTNRGEESWLEVRLVEEDGREAEGGETE